MPGLGGHSARFGRAQCQVWAGTVPGLLVEAVDSGTLDF